VVRGQAMCVYDGESGRCGRGRPHLNHRYCSGYLTPRGGVDQDQQVAAVEKVICEVDAPDADVLYFHAFGQRGTGQAPRHLDTEAVIAGEHAAATGVQHPTSSERPHGSSTSSGAKYRNRPCDRCRSAAGSPTSVTARYCRSSTSDSTASTVA